jgi:ATP/maltotriose-dependent transcriptional regulator MalT
LALGELDEAVRFLKENMRYADRSSDAFMPIGYRCSLAYVLYQMRGDLEEKRVNDLFNAAWQRDQPHLVTELPSFQYLEFLVARKLFNEAVAHIGDMQRKTGEKESRFGVSLATLMLGVVHLRQGRFDRARKYLDEALHLLRHSTRLEFLAHCMLARAELCRATQKFPEAWRNLEETREIAERGELRLYQADFHLEAVRLALASANAERGVQDPTFTGLRLACDHYDKARQLVGRAGYHRRDPELQELKNALEI